MTLASCGLLTLVSFLADRAVYIILPTEHDHEHEVLRLPSPSPLLSYWHAVIRSYLLTGQRLHNPSGGDPPIGCGQRSRPSLPS